MQTMTPAAPSRNSVFSVLDLCLIAMFAAMMAVFSWITVPMPAPLVPFTMQTFGIFITLELPGAPVLSGFSGGMGVLLGSTGGYILGFLLTAGLYWLTEALLGKALWVRLTALIGGLLLCYLFGTLWFMVIYARTNAAIGIGTALLWCVVPYLAPDIVKLVLAFGLSAAIKHRVSI